MLDYCPKLLCLSGIEFSYLKLNLLRTCHVHLEQIAK